MTDIERELDRIGVRAPTPPKPTRKPEPAVWKPQNPNEECPF